jgi:hypothetical protein
VRYCREKNQQRAGKNRYGCGIEQHAIGFGAPDPSSTRSLPRESKYSEGVFPGYSQSRSNEGGLCLLLYKARLASIGVKSPENVFHLPRIGSLPNLPLLAVVAIFFSQEMIALARFSFADLHYYSDLLK